MMQRNEEVMVEEEIEERVTCTFRLIEDLQSGGINVRCIASIYHVVRNGVRVVVVY